VFRPKIPKSDNRFFDPSNTWYVYENEPLKQSLEKFANFPISTSFENNEPRLLLIAVDIQEGIPVISIAIKRKMEQENLYMERITDQNLMNNQKVTTVIIESSNMS
jgi:hypothetical protein